MKKLNLFLAFLVFILTGFSANSADWKIVDTQSKISFGVAQNNSIVVGDFKKFGGKINFDPKDLKNSKVEIEIDINSVESTTPQAAATLKENDWFAVQKFAKATFVSTKFTKVNDKKYIVEGNLTIKGVSKAIKMNFSLEDYSATKALALGSVQIKRSDFGVGAKNPENAHGVKDDVNITFMVSAKI